MNKMGTHMSAFLIMIVVLTSCITEESKPETSTKEHVTNFVLNGGFEEGDATPLHWIVEASRSPGLEMYRDSTVSYSGDASLAIMNSDKTNSAFNVWKQTIKEPPVCKRLIISGFIKIEDLGWVNPNCAGKTGVHVEVKDTQGTVIRDIYYRYYPWLVHSHDWIEIQGDLFLSSEAKELQITAFLQGEGQVWFDDIQLTKASVETKQWTVMFYDDADFPGFNPKTVFENEAYATEDLNVLILEDTYGGPASTWSLQENGRSVKVKENGEVNMASYETLKDFIVFCKKWYPAERYMLLLYDHGAGWEGACVDKTDSSDWVDWLTPDEMKQAITETGGIDIIGFSAPCFMGAIEPVYELRDCVDVYIGSEAPSGYICWRGIIGNICETLDKNTDLSTSKVGNVIIESIRDNATSPSLGLKREITMSAVQTDKIGALAEAIDTLASDLIQRLPASRESIEEMEDTTQWVVDIYTLADKLSRRFPELRENTQKVKDTLSEAIINECHGDEHPDAHGLTVYFPQLHPEHPSLVYDPSYATSNLDFIEDTHWDEFLALYNEETENS